MEGYASKRVKKRLKCLGSRNQFEVAGTHFNVARIRSRPLYNHLQSVPIYNKTAASLYNHVIRVYQRNWDTSPNYHPKPLLANTLEGVTVVICGIRNSPQNASDCTKDGLIFQSWFPRRSPTRLAMSNSICRKYSGNMGNIQISPRLRIPTRHFSSWLRCFFVWRYSTFDEWTGQRTTLTWHSFVRNFISWNRDCAPISHSWASDRAEQSRWDGETCYG